jgi:hypothetical protein
MILRHPSLDAGVDNAETRCHGDVESSQDGEFILPLKLQVADTAYRVTVLRKHKILCVICPYCLK